MSRFVSGGTVDEPVERDDAWLKAQQEIEARIRQKEDQGRQDSGKSLYETLQANKAAKQDAFDEASKLKNQFRALDDDEIDFLDSVLESTRAKEAEVKKDTAEQLNAFRQQREKSEKAARSSEDPSVSGEKDSWTVGGGKKRKREKGGQIVPGLKLRKSSSGDKTAVEKPSSGIVTSGSLPDKPTTSDVVSKPNIASVTRAQSVKSLPPAAKTNLGLGGYSSDDED